MKARRLFDADATDGYLLDGKYWIDPLIAGVKTNADRIRAMTDEELAQEIWSCHVFASFADLLDWLKKEVKEGE